MMTNELHPTELKVVSPIKVSGSEQYDVIITDAEDTIHYFLRKDGELFYDGYCRPGSGDVDGIPPFDPKK